MASTTIPEQVASGAATPPSWATIEGLPFPMGASWVAEERAWNFALYSKHAERVALLLYAAADVVHPVCEYELDYLRNKSGRVWHCRVQAERAPGALYYAYRLAGPRPAGRLEWHAFDADKVLLDPYAISVYFPPGFDRAAACRPGSNAGKAPLAVLPRQDGQYEWGSDRARRHESDAVMYELHVGGFTGSPSSGLSRAERGTFAGLMAKVPYLQELGVTVVELMPVFQYDPQGRDRWGYMPLDFFAPHQAYCAGDAESARTEFRDLVKALHAAGIEVVLDAVYNHTCEGASDGPTYSYKGIDNSTYYLMTGDLVEPYADLAGTGNTLNCANHAVRRMILDSMRYWVEEMHVDGFRFDLASIFARRIDGSLDLQVAPMVADVASEDELRQLRLIAEPWDAAGTNALGRAFPGSTWHQWNASFRDDVRRFMRGDAGMVPALMRRLYGSDDLFPDDRLHAYRPSQSVNYVTCHDGFTLYDVVSYNGKRNWANGEDNRDGATHNYSWNCGWEGDDNVPDDVLALRRRQARNLIALLFLANGTPMLRAGDEFLQTQFGNNNPYSLDNETTWLDWNRLETNGGMHRFVKQAIAFRKAHPSIGRSRFWRDDVRWYGVNGGVDISDESRALAYCLHGASQGDRDLYVMINAWQEPLAFTIQEGSPDEWLRVIDTSATEPDDFLAPGREAPVFSPTCTVGARSVVVLLRR